MIGGVCGVWRGLFQPYARKVSRQNNVTEWETTPPDPADPANKFPTADRRPILGNLRRLGRGPSRVLPGQKAGRVVRGAWRR